MLRTRKTTRREFLEAWALVLVTRGSGSGNEVPGIRQFRRGGMVDRRLGQTDMDVSLLSFGSHTDPADRRPAGPAELIKSLERIPDETLCMAAMRFVYSRPFVATAITGMFEERLLEDNLKQKSGKQPSRYSIRLSPKSLESGMPPQGLECASAGRNRLLPVVKSSDMNSTPKSVYLTRYELPTWASP